LCVRRARLAIVAPDMRHSRRSQAETPLIGLSEFTRPPLWTANERASAISSGLRVGGRVFLIAGWVERVENCGVCHYRRLGRGAVTITGGLPDVSGATSCIAASPAALSAQGFLIARMMRVLLVAA
jgi:hypothetical protein